MIDAAYVPVMVATACDKTDDTKELSYCKDAIYALKDVTAKNDIRDAGAPGIPPEKAKELINMLKKAQEESEAAETRLMAAASDRATRQSENDAIKLKAAEDKEKAAEKDKCAADERFKKLLADLNLMSGQRHDAYSVFGTFTADTKVGVGASRDVGLQIGKVFSTGLASQNLTEGLRVYYQTAGGSQCLATAKDLVSAYEKSLGVAKADQNTTGGTDGSTEGKQNSSAAKTDKTTTTQTTVQAPADKLTDTEKKKKLDEFYQMVIKACAVK